MKIIILITILLIGCMKDSRPYKCTITDVYLEDCKVNDGVVQRCWKTAFSIEGYTKIIKLGKYGKIGEIVYLKRSFEGYWYQALPK